MYYFRVLIERWLQPDWFRILGGGSNPWSIDLGEAPGAKGCVLTILGASAVLTAVAMLAFTQREFRVKTPEGS